MLRAWVHSQRWEVEIFCYCAHVDILGTCTLQLTFYFLLLTSGENRVILLSLNVLQFAVAAQSGAF